jgi:thiol:disulfide interchange protein DsbC
LIWCAANKAKAWEDWIFHNQLPKTSANCDVPLERVGELARTLGVTSTPTLIFSDGKRMLGAQPYKEIERALVAAHKK